MGNKVVIIGAGLTGLSAGIHLQQKGVETEIFEIRVISLMAVFTGW
jgi:phytoene dehydrogenase-like protein